MSRNAYFILSALLLLPVTATAEDISGLDADEESPTPRIENVPPVQTPAKSYRDTEKVYAKVKKEFEKFDKCVSKQAGKRNVDEKISACQDKLEKMIAEAPPKSREKLKKFIIEKTREKLEGAA